MIKNLYSGETRIVRGHEGKDRIQLSRTLDLDGQNSTVQFVDFAVIPPGSSIGIHDHKEIEEVYIILEGEGTMTLGDDHPRVVKGDVLFIPPHLRHGLTNDRTGEIRLLVCGVKRN